MINFIRDIGQDLGQLSRGVHIWMRWFNFLFVVGAVLAIWYVPARWAVLAHFLCFPVGFALYHYTRNIGLMGSPHILFWTPLLVYLPTAASNEPGFQLISLYGLWMLLLLPTVAVAVIFDIKALFSFFASKRGI